MFSWLSRLWKKKPTEDSNTLYVGNLQYSVSRHDLNDLFSSIGPIENTRIIRDTRTRKSKGFGFVTFSDAHHASEALSMEGTTLKGRPIRVRVAHSKGD